MCMCVSIYIYIYIFKYLKGTTDIGLVYHGDTSCALVGYSNFDCAADLDEWDLWLGTCLWLTTILLIGKQHFSPQWLYPL